MLYFHRADDLWPQDRVLGVVLYCPRARLARALLDWSFLGNMAVRPEQSGYRQDIITYQT